jgi:hypothetical protein
MTNPMASRSRHPVWEAACIIVSRVSSNSSFPEYGRELHLASRTYRDEVIWLDSDSGDEEDYVGGCETGQQIGFLEQCILLHRLTIIPNAR